MVQFSIVQLSNIVRIYRKMCFLDIFGHDLDINIKLFILIMMIVMNNFICSQLNKIY